MRNEEGINRRSLLKTAAWGVPVVALAVAAPAVAASSATPVLVVSLGPPQGSFRSLFVIALTTAGDPIVGATLTRQTDFASFGWINNGTVGPTDLNGAASALVLNPGNDRHAYRVYLEVDGVRYTSNEVPNI